MSNNLASHSLDELSFKNIYRSLNSSEIIPTAVNSARQGQPSVVAQASQVKLKLDAGKKSLFAAGAGPTLPKPKGKQNVQTLMILAEAFGKAFKAIASGVVSQTEDYVELQQLDETMSNGVLKTQTDAIDKEEAAITLQAKITKEEKKEAGIMDWLEPVMIVLAVVMIAVSLVATFFDGGATAEMIPEEIEMTGELFELPQSLEEPEELAEGEDVKEADDASEKAGNESKAPEFMQNTQKMMSQDINGLEDGEQRIARTFSRVAVAEDDAPTSLAKKMVRILFKLGVGAVFGSPMLITGIYNTGPLYQQRCQLAHLQRQMGVATAVMQETDIIFKFFQKVIQREGSVLQEEVAGSAQVVQTFADITNAWKGITYGLGQVV
ncbi:MAG: hypothetical protein K940chlam9_00378 [Chlamydiae bacterium]|nr:hypothetical protein [Chlamydiota bacterium]